jgi:uncharacterized membrane protein
MPYQWHHDATGQSRLTLWSHRSLQAGGFVAFIAITAGLMAIPLLANLGSRVLWVLLAFMLAAVVAIWAALRRNLRDRHITEELVLTPNLARLSHSRAGGETLLWQANPYWVRVTLHPKGGPVPHYLTLKGTDREVEIGAFLTEAERLTLAGELRATLAALK